jgi:hypothetical protein
LLLLRRRRGKSAAGQWQRSRRLEQLSSVHDSSSRSKTQVLWFWCLAERTRSTATNIRPFRLRVHAC